MKNGSSNCFLLKIESFDGDDTFLHCGDGSQDYLICVVKLTEAGELAIVDGGYRSEAEALKSWPGAKPTAH